DGGSGAQGHAGRGCRMSSAPLKAIEGGQAPQQKEEALNTSSVSIASATSTAAAPAARPAAPAPADAQGNSSKPNMKYLLHALLKHGASDLHLRAGRPPMYRINGKLVVAKMQDLSAEAVKHILYSILNDKLIRDFEKHLQVDRSFQLEGMGRF